MKIKVKVKVLTEGCMPSISDNGECIDLRAAKDIDITAPQSGVLQTHTIAGETVKFRNVEIPVVYIPLGVAMQLPKGYEAHIYSRSGSPVKFNTFIPNGVGIVDNSYSGDSDVWQFVCSPLSAVTIHKGDRICQFRVCLSQKATVWQKLKWLLSSGIKLVETDHLNRTNRGMNVTGK